jgi:glycosyltransferase involved in cell wall biosynthesis
MSCLRGAGVQVTEVHASLWDDRRHAWNAGLGDALRLAAAEARLLARSAPDADALVVGYPGHLDLVAARRAARGRAVVFNPLVSLADTFVSDRGRFRPGSLPARLLSRVDRAALDAADVVVADTAANAEFFAQLTRTPIEVCFVGAEDRLFAPGWAGSQPFEALFVGKLIPLQGVEAILEAARLAPDVRFRLVGSGQLDALLEARPPNVAHVPWVEYELLPTELRAAGCALGIFGTSPKAARVIPNKAFQALAVGAPLVTADTPAARELLVDGESALLVPPGDAQALAAAVRRLAEDATLAARLSTGGRRAYEEHASEPVLGARWRELIERTVAAKAAG